MKNQDMTYIPPRREEILDLRQSKGLTQTQAAELCCAKLRAYQYWESGTKPMPRWAWALFTLRTAND